jgi:glycosyltransferase involved in cell wall biosynthesis
MNMDPKRAKSRPEFTIVLPAFNEANVVARVVDAHHAALAKLFRSFEILVIDDASTDSTYEAALAVAKRFEEVHVHRNAQNIGQAASLRIGFKLARGEIVMHNAFDLPFAPDDFALVKDAVHAGADVVVVERQSRAAYGIVRKVVSHGNVLLLRALFRCPIHDYNFVQAYRRSVVETVEAITTAAGSVTPEMIVRASRAGFRVVRVSATYHGRRVGRSTVGVRTVLTSLAQTFGLFLAVRGAAAQDLVSRQRYASTTNGAGMVEGRDAREARATRSA